MAKIKEKKQKVDKQKRIQSTKEWLVTAGKVAGILATIAGAIYIAIVNADDEKTESNEFDSLTYGDDSNRCSNCGNSDSNTLWDEDDTIYCSKCCHRTLKSTGEDDLVECPFCHRMRDRKALYCRHCNDSTWKESTPEEFAEIDEILKEYQN